MTTISDKIKYIDFMSVMYAMNQLNIPITFHMFKQYSNDLKGLIHYLYFMEEWLNNLEFRHNQLLISLTFDCENDIQTYYRYKSCLSPSSE